MSRLPLRGLIIALVVFVIGQVLKVYLIGSLGLAVQGDRLQLLPIFDLVRVHNLGVSLGMLQASSETVRWALVGLTGAIALGVLVWMFRETNRQDQFALGLVLGGAASNILDRVTLGYVFDYADLHFGDWHPFLVFNVADAAITIGVLILLIRALLVRDTPKKATSSVENVNA